MRNDSKPRFVDICLSDGLPCSGFIKGVGLGGCIENLSDGLVVCSRFSDVSLFEDFVSKKLAPEQRFGVSEEAKADERNKVRLQRARDGISLIKKLIN